MNSIHDPTSEFITLPTQDEMHRELRRQDSIIAGLTLALVAAVGTLIILGFIMISTGIG
jgi:CHASE3 domain sensor protein